jgi:hypothetical protein
MGAHPETSSVIVHLTSAHPAIVNSALPGSEMVESVIETVKRVSDEALGLLDRRSEINRRIRELHQLLHGLNDLSASAPRFANANNRSPRREQLTDERPHNGSRREGVAFSPACRNSRTPKHPHVRLRRACRIALLEAGGAASLEEIRALIVRRGSFAWLEPDSSCSAILHTLQQLRASGEIRCVKSNPQPVWECIPRADEADLPS